MAIKVLTPIGTDGGITEELYIRISNYQINKQGSANFQLQLCLKEEDSKLNNMLPPIGGNFVRNTQIGDNLYIPLIKEVTVTRTGTRLVPIVDGGEAKSEEYSYTETQMVPDLSPLADTNLFTFAYSTLKAKIKGLFPAAKIVDC